MKTRLLLGMAMQSVKRLAITLTLSPRRGNHQWTCREKSLTGGPSPALEKLLPLLGERAGVRESVSSALHGCGLLLVAALILVTPGRCQAADEQSIKTAIRGVLDQQVKDWNDGSIEKFMRGYAKSDSTRFASGGEIRLGWQTVFDRYKKTYGDKAAMGKLTFSDLDITVFSDNAALAFGRWKLEREKDEPSGLFTLVFRKTKDGWRIVHDHTSAASKN